MGEESGPSCGLSLACNGGGRLSAAASHNFIVLYLENTCIHQWDLDLSLQCSHVSWVNIWAHLGPSLNKVGERHVQKNENWPQLLQKYKGAASSRSAAIYACLPVGNITPSFGPISSSIS